MAKALWLQGYKGSQIAAKIPVKARTVDTWANRFKWSALLSKTTQIVLSRVKPVENERSDALRESFANELHSAANALSKSPISHYRELPNTPEGQGRAVVLKTLVETADKLYGWSAQASGNTYNFAVLESADPIAIDVPSTSEPAKPTNKMKTEQIKKAFHELRWVFDSAMINHAQALFEQCRAEEKQHRGFMPDFDRCHTPDTISVADAARLFAVKRVAEYLLAPDKYPKGQDYLHTQKSCFIAAGIADEFRAQIVEAWKDFDVAALALLDYTDYVKINRQAA